jgi:hypothetical protein
MRVAVSKSLSYSPITKVLGGQKLNWMQFSGRSRSFSGPFFLLLKIVKKIF